MAGRKAHPERIGGENRSAGWSYAFLKNCGKERTQTLKQEGTKFLQAIFFGDCKRGKGLFK